MDEEEFKSNIDDIETSAGFLGKMLDSFSYLVRNEDRVNKSVIDLYAGQARKQVKVLVADIEVVQIMLAQKDADSE